nr:magnesium transporter [Methylonatrum kenyense]
MELLQLFRADRGDLLERLLEEMAVQDIADAMQDLGAEEMAALLRKVPAERRTPVFAYLAPGMQFTLLDQLPEGDARALLAELVPDDRTALLERLEPEQSERLLKLLPAPEMQEAMRLLGYPERSAGRLMTPRFLTVKEDWTVERALDYVRDRSAGGETVNVVFVVDQRNRLLGRIRLRDFVLGRPSQRIADIMQDDPVSIIASESREEAARLMQHYDLEVLPVLDQSGVLLGIVTVDDVIDVVEEEATEDFHKMGSVGVLNLSLKEARPSLLYRKRVGWLVLLVFMNIFGGAAIAHFEDTIEAVIALVFFLPLIVDSGGNAGSQSATLMVRALATGDVRMKDWLRLWGKELGVATALGLTMGLAVSTIGLWRGGPEVAIVVALAMVCVVIVGSMIGMLLPFLLTRMKLDPATASAPLITSIADICGIMIYFSIATAVLTLPAGG